MKSYIKFENLRPTGKTRITRISTVEDGYTLGVIKFFGPWRQYTFQPYENTVLNSDCMMEITAKLDEMNKEIRAEWAARRKAKAIDK